MNDLTLRGEILDALQRHGIATAGLRPLVNDLVNLAIKFKFEGGQVVDK